MLIEKISVSRLKSGALFKLLPEVYEMKDVVENNEWHNNEDIFSHILKVLNNFETFLRKNRNNKIRTYMNKRVDFAKIKDLIFFSILLHDVGKKWTVQKKKNIINFPGHEIISAKKSKKILNRFFLSDREKNIILCMIKNHTALHIIIDPENKNLGKDFKKFYKKKELDMIGFVLLVMMDTLNSYLKKTKPEQYNFRVLFYKKTLNSLSEDLLSKNKKQ